MTPGAWGAFKNLISSLSSSDCAANMAAQIFFRAFLWPETTHKIPSVLNLG